MPKHQTATTTTSDENHTTHALVGRRTGILRDVLLGWMEVPLSSLLIKHTGRRPHSLFYLWSQKWIVIIFL